MVGWAFMVARCHDERVSRSPERSESEASRSPPGEESLIPLRSAVPLEKQTLDEKAFPGDRYNHNKPKKAQNYEDF